VQKTSINSGSHTKIESLHFTCITIQCILFLTNTVFLIHIHTYLHSFCSYSEVRQTKPVCSNTNNTKLPLVILPITVSELVSGHFTSSSCSENTYTSINSKMQVEFIVVMLKKYVSSIQTRQVMYA